MAGYTVTLAAADTNYKLADLLTAIDSGITGGYSELILQSDQGNGAAVIRVGDVNLTDNRCAFKLNAGESRTRQLVVNGINLSEYYLRCNLAGKTVNVTLEEI